jgi:copper chaperone
MTLTKTKLAVEGLHCGCCAVSLGIILRTVQGVTSARADFDTKTVDIEYDRALANLQTMNKAIEGLGYRMEEIGK